MEIVQVLSTKERPTKLCDARGEQCDAFPELAINGSSGSPRKALKIFASVVCRKDLNHPPTAVGGILESPGCGFGRKDLNHPPTARRLLGDMKVSSELY